MGDALNVRARKRIRREDGKDGPAAELAARHPPVPDNLNTLPDDLLVKIIRLLNVSWPILLGFATSWLASADGMVTLALFPSRVLRGFCGTPSESRYKHNNHVLVLLAFVSPVPKRIWLTVSELS
jgi:hypothetical protein